MKRDMMNSLVEWKESRRRKPLILTGVRQCGKTYLLKEFAASYFENYMYVNFESSDKYESVFSYDFDTKRIISELEILEGISVVPGKTLVIFDEIQECPRAITSLKYFCENMRDLHVVCAGSLLGVALRQNNISFPVGKVNRKELYPMSFHEFVEACGESRYLKILETWPVNREIPEVYSTPMKQLLKNYFIVGGMPEAVSEWCESHDYEAVEEIQEEILQDYADDFSKHAPARDIEKIRMVWDSIPIQLAKENNKFVFSHVKKGKRAHELEGALEWLKLAGLAYMPEKISDVQLPLYGNADKSYFKVYMSDIGLLRKRSGLSYSTILYEDEKYRNYKGALAENYALTELSRLFDKTFFWRSGNTAEVDFVVEQDSRIIPIEVKAAENTQAKSYRLFCKKYSPEKGYKFSLKNIAENMCENTSTISLPLYLIWNMKNY